MLGFEYKNMIMDVSKRKKSYVENMVIPAISVALGARIIEKHYTMSRSMTGSGHYFSLEPSDVTKMVKNIR